MSQNENEQSPLKAARALRAADERRAQLSSPKAPQREPGDYVEITWQSNSSRPTEWSALKTSPRREKKSKCSALSFRVRMMPECGHVFHSHCIDQWFQTKVSNEIHCPHCNIKLLTRREIDEKMKNEMMMEKEEKKDEQERFERMHSQPEERKV